MTQHCELQGSSGTDGPQDMQNSDPLCDAEGAAAYLGLVGVVKHPGQVVRALCRKKRLRHTWVGGRIMIRQSWLEEYITNNCKSAA